MHRSRRSIFPVFLLVGFLAHAAYGQTPAPVVTYPAGSYTLVFTVPAPFTGPFVITQVGDVLTVTWGVAPIPIPVPVPVPVPPAPVPPAPAPPPLPLPVIPAGTHVWGLAIYDDSSGAAPLSAGQLTAKASPTLLNSGELLDMTVKFYAKSDPTISSWSMKVTAFPALLFVTKGPDGKGVLTPGAAIPLPDDESAILADAGKVRGK